MVSLRSAWFAKCADRQQPTYTWVSDGGSGGVREWDRPAATAAPRDSCENPGRSRRTWSLGQVVFLFGFDGVMLTIANDHWVQVVMFGLFDFGPGRPAQRVDEEESGCLTAELLTLDLLLRESVGVRRRQQCGNVLVLGQRERLAPTDRPVSLGVLS